MDLWRMLVWAGMMLLIGFLVSSMDMAVFVAHVKTWWLTALVGAMLIYYLPGWLEEPDSPYWIVWLVCMAIYLTGYGYLMNGNWLGVTLWWHWAVAALSALVMHYAAPWGRRYFPA